MSALFDAPGFSILMVRFWRVEWHREGLNALAIAVSRSDEADRLEYEWSLISEGTRREFTLRQEWATDGLHGDDPYGWQYSDKWRGVNSAYGPAKSRHRACLCKWLHVKGYPSSISVHGGAGDAGGRARRIKADLDSAVGSLPPNLSEQQIERRMAEFLGWRPPPLPAAA